MKPTSIKPLAYESMARMGKCLSSAKRLELLGLLAQGEKTVESLAVQTGIDIGLTSAHLKALREARLVETRRDGKYIHYRLSGPKVSSLWNALREAATEHLIELRLAMHDMAGDPGSLYPESRESLLEKAGVGDVIVIDVRQSAEYEAAHLPYARSIPLAELQHRLADLPKDCTVVAYCRGPFCVMSDEAVALLRTQGYNAMKISDGVIEWAACGLPLETTNT
jgi:rhodanese-related sulfurtransferase/DNA-binding transcriptional ArsR family regulator